MKDIKELKDIRTPPLDRHLVLRCLFFFSTFLRGSFFHKQDLLVLIGKLEKEIKPAKLSRLHPNPYSESFVFGGLRSAVESRFFRTLQGKQNRTGKKANI